MVPVDGEKRDDTELNDNEESWEKEKGISNDKQTI